MCLKPLNMNNVLVGPMPAKPLPIRGTLLPLNGKGKPIGKCSANGRVYNG